MVVVVVVEFLVVSVSARLIEMICTLDGLQTMGRSLATVSKFVVTRQRTEILPVIAATIAAHPGTHQWLLVPLVFLAQL
jgi:hypothetical protein